MTPEQKTATDALVASFGKFLAAFDVPAGTGVPVVTAPVVNPTTPQPGPGITPPPAVGAVWYKPTDAATAAFAKRIGWSVADLLGARQAKASPGPGMSGSPMGGTRDPEIASFDGTEDDARLYAAFGFNPVTGTRPIGFPGQLRQRGSWAVERAEAQVICDMLYNANSPEEAERVITGAGDPAVDMNLAIFLVLIGKVSPFTGGGDIHLLRGGDWHTIPDACKGLAEEAAKQPPADPGTGGPGPSGR